MFDTDILNREYQMTGPLLSDTDLEALTIRELDLFETGRGHDHGLPADLAEWLPGPYTAVVVSSIDRTRLSGYQVVDLLRAESHLVSHYQAAMYASMSEISHRSDPEHGYEEEAYEYAADEIRAALTLTRRAADIELDTASEVHERLPQLGAALSTGQIDLRRARTISHGTSHLDDATAVHVTEQTLRTAPKLTTGQIAARLRRTCIAADPGNAKKEFVKGLEARRFWTELNPDGTANLYGLNLAPDRVSAITRRITQLARQLKTKTDSRTLDQVRADTLVDLLTGDGSTNVGSGGRGHVDITVELTTLAGLDDHPGELAGMGPVIADIARQAVREQPDTQWTYTITDQGRPLATGTTRRRPTNAITRQVQARYQTCVFPGCRMPARSCDLDHQDPWANGGSTTTNNLATTCRHDHLLKHDKWETSRQPNGDHTWTSPLGHVYTTSPRPP